MKWQIYAIIIFSAFTYGCISYGKIETINDDIEYSKIYKMNMFHKSHDQGKASRRVECVYSKKVNNTRSDPILINMKIQMYKRDSAFSKKCYIVVDDNKHELQLGDVDIQASTRSHSSTNSTTGTTKSTVSVVNYTLANLQLTNTIENQIKNCKKLLIRLYIGIEPITFVITQADLNKIKELIECK